MKLWRIWHAQYPRFVGSREARPTDHERSPFETGRATQEIDLQESGSRETPYVEQRWLPLAHEAHTLANHYLSARRGQPHNPAHPHKAAPNTRYQNRSQNIPVAILGNEIGHIPLSMLGTQRSSFHHFSKARAQCSLFPSALTVMFGHMKWLDFCNGFSAFGHDHGLMGRCFPDIPTRMSMQFTHRNLNGVHDNECDTCDAFCQWRIWLTKVKGCGTKKFFFASHPGSISSKEKRVFYMAILCRRRMTITPPQREKF